MRVKSTIVNMPESKLQTREYDDWYKEIINEWDGMDYKLNRKTIIDDINGLDNDTEAKVFENGIVINIIRKPVVKEDSRYDEEYDATPTEIAQLYILDNGEAYYIHRGFFVGPGYTSYLGVSDLEFDISSITNPLSEKLGREYKLEKELDNNDNNFATKIRNNNIKLRNKNKAKLMKQKIDRLIALAKESIKIGEYEESVCTYDPETKTAVEERLQKVV